MRTSPPTFLPPLHTPKGDTESTPLPSGLKNKKHACVFQQGGPSSKTYIYIYIHIYILDSHMAPYGACEVAQSTARSNAQFEAERFRKGLRRKTSMVESAFEGKTNMLERAFEGKRSMLEQCFRALSGFKACSSSDFERSVAFRRYKKQARAVISSAQRPKSKLEQ